MMMVMKYVIVDILATRLLGPVEMSLNLVRLAEIH